MQPQQDSEKILKNIIQLNKGEEEELRDCQALYEMDKSNSGWQIVKKWLEDMAFHSWIDPRTCTSEEDWKWKEMNAFAAATVAKEILENIAVAVNRSDYLEKVKSGEINRKTMAIK